MSIRMRSFLQQGTPCQNGPLFEFPGNFPLWTDHPRGRNMPLISTLTYLPVFSVVNLVGFSPALSNSQPDLNPKLPNLTGAQGPISRVNPIPDH